MDMKKITVVVLVIAALMSLVVTAKDSAKTPAAAPKGAKPPLASATPAGAPKDAHAPKASGAAPTTLSIAGSFFNSFLVSFFAYYMQ
ncbi:hypothetical protein ACLB2K_059745 [Fragaria x ananassa]